MSLIISGNFDEKWVGEFALKEWLLGLGIFTHALTITLIRGSFHTPHLTRIESEKALKRYIRIVNNCCFQKAFNRGNKSLPCAAVYETKLYDENPHIHLAIGSPHNMNPRDFENILVDTIGQIRMFNKIYDLKPVVSSGWIGYLIKNGSDSLISSCCMAER